MSSIQAKRHFSRIPFDAQTRVFSLDKSQHWQCDLFDISLNGALTSKPVDCELIKGEHFKLEIQLGVKHDSEMRLHMDVSVSHVEDDHVGFKILQMDVDTASHLHRIIELNLGDTDMLKRELVELIKQHE